MKRVLAVFLGACILLSMFVSASAESATPVQGGVPAGPDMPVSTENAGPDMLFRAAAPTPNAEDAPPAADTALSGLDVTVYDVANPSNVIVQFLKDGVGEFWGATDIPNYVVTDEAGNECAIVSIASAYAEIGGAATDVFKLTFAQPLAPGDYSVTVSNLFDSLQPPIQVFDPVTTSFTVSGESPGTLTGLDVSVYDVVDSGNVIVQFLKDGVDEFWGATDIPNYVVAGPSGNECEIVSIASAYAEIGGAATDVFKLTFAQPLAPGTYSVTVSNLFDSLQPPVQIFAPMTASFEVTDQSSELLTGLDVTIYEVVNASNVIVQFVKDGAGDYWGATDIPSYRVSGQDGAVYSITGIASAYMELGGDALDVFKITFSQPLAPGTYSLTVSGLYDSLQPPVRRYAPMTVSLTMPEGLDPGPLGPGFHVGVGEVDITPDEPVLLMGGTSPILAEEVDTPLSVKAMVFAQGTEKAAIITVDTLKYPDPELALNKVAERCGISPDNNIITASHTHSAPYYTYYGSRLTNAMVTAVKNALQDLEPCSLGYSGTQVDDISRNRRVLIDGECWNYWLAGQDADTYEPAGPTDRELMVLAAKDAEGKYKAVLWNFACHANGNKENKISADYPGHAQEQLAAELGYDVPALFVPGACGDINPADTPLNMGKAIAGGIADCLGGLKTIEQQTLSTRHSVFPLPVRSDPVFAEEEIARKWPAQLETYRTNFGLMMNVARPQYKAIVSGIRLGDEFAIASNPGELFCQLGLDIKESSPFAGTMVVEASNGMLGYMPTENDFAVRGYETWFAEHSFLDVGAGETVRDRSCDILDILAADEAGEGGSVLDPLRDENGLVPGLRVSIYDILDSSNVIVQFNLDAYLGYTDVANYQVVNALGEPQTVVSAVSAYAQYEVPSGFILTFASPLPAGDYTVTVSGISYSPIMPDDRYAPATVTLHIGGEAP